MLRWLNKNRGQNTAEYAILIGVIVAAAIAMQVYVRRGIQAHIKDGVDYTMNVTDDSGNKFFSQKQYEPYYMNTDFTTTQTGTVNEQLQQGGGLLRNSISDTTTRYGNQTYGNYTSGN